MHLWKYVLKKVNLKELQPLYFTPYSSSFMLFHAVFVVRHANVGIHVLQRHAKP
jgi:hypothetical protein